MLVTLIDTALEETTSHSPARTLADVRDVLARLVETDPKETKLQLSAINTIARASHCAPEDLSADPARLRQHLHSMSASFDLVQQNLGAFTVNNVEFSVHRCARLISLIALAGAIIHSSRRGRVQFTLSVCPHL